MKWYLKVIRDNYANFEGRARREKYWMFFLFNSLFIVGIAMISGSLAMMTDNQGFLAIFVIYLFGIMIPSGAVAVRRLHDINKSGWQYLIGFIPIIGRIWLLILLVTEGDNGPNHYGPDPKCSESLEIDQIGTVY